MNVNPDENAWHVIKYISFLGKRKDRSRGTSTVSLILDWKDQSVVEPNDIPALLAPEYLARVVAIIEMQARFRPWGW